MDSYGYLYSADRSLFEEKYASTSDKNNMLEWLRVIVKKIFLGKRSLPSKIVTQT